MIKAVMVVKDIKGKIFVQPHVVETVEIAIRDFKEAASDEKKQSTLAKYPGDYDLLHIGWFNPEKGTIEPIEPTVALHGKHIGQKENVVRENEGTGIKPVAIN